MDAPSVLPTGGCNFCDLAQGAAPRCGCQRFWLRRKRRGGRAASKAGTESAKGRELSRISRAAKPDADADADAGEDEDDDADEECRCGHHACFHSFESPVSVRTQSTGRRYSLQISDTETSLRLDRSGTNLAASSFSITSGTTTDRDYSTTTADQSPSVVAARNIKAPPHPYQPSLLSSQSSASKSTSRTETRFTDVLRGVQSALEGINSRFDLARPASAAAAPPPSPGLADIGEKLTALIAANEKLQQSSRSHHERLETVETFGSVLEEIRDKLELAEDRANEVEEKVLSFENRLDDRLAPLESVLKRKPDPSASTTPLSRKRHCADPPDTKSSFTSTATTTSNSNCSSSAEKTAPRLLGILERLESRLIDLESCAPPTISRPWIVEAVLLPPAPLPGVWTDAAGASTAGYESSNPHSVSTHSGGSCTAAAAAATTLRRPLEDDGDDDDDDGSDGLPRPRSFAKSSRLYRRLASRGFVKSLVVTGPAARDVAAAVETAFGGLLEWCCAFCARPQGGGGGAGGWQPLRKAHKQTILEFLQPGERVQGLWGVEFLNGCVMKGRRKVLYITPVLPKGEESGVGVGVGWADVKALPETPVEGGAGGAEEGDCWEWKDTLDEPVRAPTVSVSPEPEAVVAAASPTWSSFGPFQREEEAKAGAARNASPVPGTSPKPSPPSPPVSLTRKRKPSSPLQEARSRGGRVRRTPEITQGLTPALTATRSSSFPTGSVAASFSGSVGRQGSGLGGLEGLEPGSWELSLGTMGWFTEHSGVLEEDSAGRKVEEVDEDEEEDEATEVLGGEEGYGSLET